MSKYLNLNHPSDQEKSIYVVSNEFITGDCYALSIYLVTFDFYKALDEFAKHSIYQLLKVAPRYSDYLIEDLEDDSENNELTAALNLFYNNTPLTRKHLENEYKINKNRSISFDASNLLTMKKIDLNKLEEITKEREERKDDLDSVKDERVNLQIKEVLKILRSN